MVIVEVDLYRSLRALRRMLSRRTDSRTSFTSAMSPTSTGVKGKQESESRLTTPRLLTVRSGVPRVPPSPKKAKP